MTGRGPLCCILCPTLGWLFQVCASKIAAAHRSRSIMGARSLFNECPLPQRDSSSCRGTHRTQQYPLQCHWSPGATSVMIGLPHGYPSGNCFSVTFITLAVFIFIKEQIVIYGINERVEYVMTIIHFLSNLFYFCAWWLVFVSNRCE